MRHGFTFNQKGEKINNLPEPNSGILTGKFEIDLYGCWWEILRKDKSKFWMIGEYPN